MFAYVYVIYFDSVYPPFPYHVLLSTLASTSSQLAPSTFIAFIYLFFFDPVCFIRVVYSSKSTLLLNKMSLLLTPAFE